MDPNANLNEQLDIANRLTEPEAYKTEEDRMRDWARLAELVLALDDWIRRGGFLPRRWEWWKDKEGGQKR